MWPRESEEAQRSAPLEPRKIRNPNRFTLLPSTPVERLLCPTHQPSGASLDPEPGLRCVAGAVAPRQATSVQTPGVTAGRTAEECQAKRQ